MYIIGKDIVNTDIELNRTNSLDEALKLWELAKQKYHDRIFVYNTKTNQCFYSRNSIIKNFQN